jgi:hypothetical protein
LDRGGCSSGRARQYKPSGAHGTVVIEGDISPDLHVTNPHIISSSHSEDLDNYALGLSGHASLASGIVVKKSSKIRLKVRLYNAGLDMMGWQDYTCRQADLDADWYKRTFPGEKEISLLYKLLDASGRLMGVKLLSFARDPSIFENAWGEAIEDCRRSRRHRSPDDSWS